MRRVFSIPTSVQMFVTVSCNLRCEHCFSEAFKSTHDGCELSSDEWCDCLSRLRSLGVLAIKLTGGEIFAREGALEIIQHAGKLGFPRGVNITTNGTLLTAQSADAVANAGIRQVSVSVDGSESIHDEVRGRAGAFKAALTGIGLLRDRSVATRIEFTLMRKTAEEFPAVVETANALGVPRVYVNRLFCQGKCSKERYLEMSLNDDECRRFSTLVEVISARFPKVQISYSKSPYEVMEQHQVAPQPKFDGFGCGAGCAECAISPYGWVLPCGQLHEFRAGNIRSTPFQAIWKNSDVLSGVRQVSFRKIEDVAFCSDCSTRSACTGGCRANAYNVHNDLLAPDPDCWRWRRHMRVSAKGE